MDKEIIVKIPQVNLKLFSKLLDQSLVVNNQLMLEFDNDMIKSCSFSSTRSLIKLWTIKTSDFVAEDVKIESFEKFNFYILNGSMFKKELSAHTGKTVDIEFRISFIDGKYQAKVITIIGTLLGSQFKTNFELTTGSMISDSVSDYSEIISACTPSDDMFEIIISSEQTTEIKKQIKNLHKTIANNTSYLSFSYKSVDKTLGIKDKVFDIEGLPMPEGFDEIVDNKPKIDFNYDILKSDFVKLGNHTFSVFTNLETEKVIHVAKFGKSLISAIITKIDSSGENVVNCDADLDSINIDDLDLSEYGIND